MKLNKLALLLAISGSLYACGGGGSESVDNSSGVEPADNTGDAPSIGAYTSDVTSLAGGDCTAHDDRVFETEHFMVFSTDDSDDTKELIGSYLETAYDEIAQALVVTDVQVKTATEKFHICSDHTVDVGSSVGSGSYNGAMFISLENPNITAGYTANGNSEYKKLIKHELMHAFEFRLIDDVSFNTHRWFSEGIATLISGQSHIGNTPEFDAFFDGSKDNPLDAITYYSIENDTSLGYYAAYGLSVKFLVDDVENSGMGNGYTGVRDLYLEMRANSQDFESAFSSVLTDKSGDSMSLSALKADYETEMRAYLLANEEIATGTVTGDADIEYTVIRDSGTDNFRVEGSVVSGSFSINIAGLEDGNYDIYFEKALDEVMVQGFGPTSITITGGVLSPTSFDISGMSTYTYSD